MVELLQRLAGSRESCFDGSVPLKVDACAVCHEVRGLRLAAGEKAHVSFSDYPGSSLNAVGEMCQLPGLKPDTVVSLKVWACNPGQRNGGYGGYPGTARSGPDIAGSERRLLGEVQLPLKALATRCEGALYHTWMQLSGTNRQPGVVRRHSPRFGDRRSDEGTPAARFMSAEEAFAQALSGARQELLEPKVCVSMLRAAVVDGASKILWSAEAARKDRIAHWGPLLRSQEQHEAICVLEFRQAANGAEREHLQVDGGRDERLAAMEAQARQQAEELAALRQSLQTNGEARGAVGSQSGADEERWHQRANAENQRREMEGIQAELDQISQQANSKIGAANEQIRTLRSQRDEAMREVERRASENGRVIQEREALAQETAKLGEQKEALLKIVEDLNQAVSSAGLGATTRRSMDGILGAGK